MSDWRYKGKTEDGIPIVEGTGSRPPLVSSLSIFVLGSMLCLVLALAVVATLAVSQRRHFTGQDYGMVLFTCALLGVCGWMVYACARSLRIRKTLVRSHPLGELAGRTGHSSDDLRQWIRAGQIKPSYIVNGQPFYDLASLERDVLLRPSSAPTNSVLLRAASGGNTPAAHLLRAQPEAVLPRVEEELR